MLAGPFSIFLRMTGCGHCQALKMAKKRPTMPAASAVGYSWQMRAVSIAQATPPRKPLMFE